MFGLPDSEAVQDLEAAADYLRALPGATGKIGAIGFCSGGRHTLLFACSSNKVDAAIDCWGGFIHRATPDAETNAARPKAPLDMVGQLNCPLFGVFGEEDQNPPVALEAELKKRAAGRRQERHDQDIQECRPRLPRRLPAELPRRARAGIMGRHPQLFRQASEIAPL